MMLGLIMSQYINILTYRPLSGSSYMDLPVELRSPKKDCHVRHDAILEILILQNNIQKE